METLSSMRVPEHPSLKLPREVSSGRKGETLSWGQRQHARIAAEAVAIWKVVKPYPSTLIWPLVVLAALLLAGVWGITRVATATADSTKDRATAMAQDAASWYRSSIKESYAPAVSFSVLIHHDPSFEGLSKLFGTAAPELMSLTPGNVLRSLQVAPNGVISLVYPNETNQLVMGHDLFEDELDRPAAIASVQYGSLVLMGPMEFRQGGYGLKARLPVFVRDVDANESFDAPHKLSAYCGSPCYNATTRTKFWGFSSALIEFQSLHNTSESRLLAISKAGYNYELLAPMWDDSHIGKDILHSTNLTRVANSSQMLHDPVEVVVDLPQARWYLRVAPRSGWTPSWYAPLLVGVVLLALAISGLIFGVLVSRRQHQVLLEALLPREMIDHLKGNAEGRLGPRIMEAATTADLLLNLLGELLEGNAPDVRDIVLIRQQILQYMDIYQPLNLSSQLRDANLDDDVTKALMHQLGGRFSFSFSSADSDLEGDPDLGDGEGGEVRSIPGLGKSMTVGHDYATLSGALAMILTPQGGWYDSGPDLSDAASDAALPTPETEVAISPRPSNNSMFGRAASHQVRQGSFRCGSPDHPNANPSPRALQTHHTNSIGSTGLRATTPIMAAGSAVVSAAAAVTEGGPGLVPSQIPEGDRAAMTASSAVSTSFVRVTEDGGASVAGAVGSGGSVLRRPPKKGDSHTSLLGLGRARRRSALLAVSIAGSVADGNGGGGASSHHMKTLSNSSHPDAVTPLHDSHSMVSNLQTRLWAASVSRRSITGAAGGSMVVKKPPTPPAPVIEEVERVLAGADSWQFDMWRLRDATNGHPLSALGYYLIHRAGLITHLKLKPPVLARLLRHIEAGYNDNPYHNAVHAADVLQTLHVIIHHAQMQVHYLDHLGLLAAYFAAIVHDYGHPGLTNDFLVSTSDPLAVRYNDRSPLENHHAAAAFSSMRRTGLDLLSPLTAEQKASFRKQVIEMVLATDMKQHFSLLSHFNTVHRITNFSNKTLAATPGGGTPVSRQCSNLGELQQVTVGVPSIEHHPAPKPLDDTERLLGLQIAIKVADLGHLGEELDVHKKWLDSLEEEFFRQGDKERQLGIPVSPLFDRSKQGVSKSQVGFYDFVGLPLVHALGAAFPGAMPLMRCFLGNYNYYRSQDAQASVTDHRGGGKAPSAPQTRTTAPQVNTPAGN